MGSFVGQRTQPMFRWIGSTAARYSVTFWPAEAYCTDSSSCSMAEFSDQHPRFTGTTQHFGDLLLTTAVSSPGTIRSRSPTWMTPLHNLPLTPTPDATAV